MHNINIKINETFKAIGYNFFRYSLFKSSTYIYIHIYIYIYIYHIRSIQFSFIISHYLLKYIYNVNENVNNKIK